MYFDYLNDVHPKSVDDISSNDNSLSDIFNEIVEDSKIEQKKKKLLK